MNLTEGENATGAFYELKNLRRDSEYRLEIQSPSMENLVFSKLLAGREAEIPYDGSLDLSYQEADQAGYWIYIDDVTLDACICRLMITYEETAEGASGEAARAAKATETAGTLTVELSGNGVTQISEAPLAWSVTGDAAGLQLRVSHLPENIYSLSVICGDDSIAKREKRPEPAETAVPETPEGAPEAGEKAEEPAATPEITAVPFTSEPLEDPFEQDLSEYVRQKISESGGEAFNLIFSVALVEKEPAMKITEVEFILRVEPAE